MTECVTIGNATLHHGDCLDVLRTLPAESVHTCITSPPYWGLRDYGVDGQIGLEDSPAEFVARLVDVFREVRRVLRSDGTLWLNLGDSYAGAPGGFQGKNGDRASRTFTARIDMEKGGDSLKPKDLCGIPWRVAFALQADGWWLRQDIIWHKPNPMPESVRDRCTKAHEYLFLLSKSERYRFDGDSIREAAACPEGPGNLAPGKYGEAYIVGDERQRTKEGLDKIGPRDTRNKRSVWTVASAPFSDAHFATFPPDLIRPCVLAGAPAGGVVLDPFNGAGTTGLVALQEGRGYVGIELNLEYLGITCRRLDPVARQERMFA